MRKIYKLSDPLINIVISFTFQTKKVLSNYFCEKVAATLVMNNIKDVEEAMTFLNSKVKELLIDEYNMSRLTNIKICNFIASYIWTLKEYKSDSLVALRHPIKEMINCVDENNRKEINKLLSKCNVTDDDIKTLLF